MLATLPQVQGGKLKVLGVSKATRMPLIADVPTIAEQGVPASRPAPGRRARGQGHAGRHHPSA